jgi:hypothetical protein
VPISQSASDHRRNIRRYEQELSFTPAGPRRQALLVLLADERAKAPRRKRRRIDAERPTATPAVQDPWT